MIYLITGNTSLFSEESSIIKYATIEESINYFKNITNIAVDTETEGFDCYNNRILSLQLGDYNNQYVIDTLTIDIRAYKTLLEDKSKVLLLQNAKFDLKFLYYHEIIPYKVFDTYLAEMVLHTGYKPGKVRMSLDALALKYCDVTLDKSIRGQIHWRGLDTKVIKYGADDVKYLENIMNAQLLEINKHNLINTINLDNEFVKTLAYIEFCGIYLNKDLWQSKMLKDQDTLNTLRNSLDNWIINSSFTKYIEQQLNLFSSNRTCKINWASSTQVIPLMKDLGVDTRVVDKKAGKIKDSVESKVLATQSDKSSLIPLYLEYKSAEKVVSTYGQSWLDQINPKTGRIHSNFRQILNTGRMSCGGKDKSKKIEYVNLQNIPADNTRTCFTKQFDSTILVNSDYSGQETVIFANKCLDKNLLAFFDKGLGDMHSYVGKLCFPKELEGIALDDVKKVRPDLRQMAKAAGFAIQFGGQGITISQNLGIPLEEGEKVYKAYFDAFTGVKEYFKVCRDAAFENGYIIFNEITNRKSFLDFHEEYLTLKKEITREFWDKYKLHKSVNSKEFIEIYKPKVRNYFKMRGDIERRSYNYPIQGSAADVTKLAGIYFFRWILKNNLFNKVKIPNIVHDEYLVECNKDISEEVSTNLQACMEKAGDVFCKRVALKATPVITEYWQH